MSNQNNNDTPIFSGGGSELYKNGKPMQNNNEKWREELMMLLHRITAEYTEWKYAKYLFSPLDDFIAFQISQAEQRGDKFGKNSKLANQYAQVIQLVYDGVPVDIAEKQIGLTN